MTAGHNRPLEPNFKSAHDWHIYHVYNDPEFIEAAELIKQLRKRPNATPQDIEAMVHDVATYFVIRVGDVNLFLLPLYLENRKKPTAIGFDLATQRFTISFEPTTTKAELLDEWKQFENMRATLFPGDLTKTKRKPPGQPDLIYAIFKARQQKATFKVIFEDYSAGKLPDYTGSTNQFKDQKKLEEYYNKFKPTT